MLLPFSWFYFSRRSQKAHMQRIFFRPQGYLEFSTLIPLRLQTLT